MHLLCICLCDSLSYLKPVMYDRKYIYFLDVGKHRLISRASTNIKMKVYLVYVYIDIIIFILIYCLFKGVIFKVSNGAILKK